MIPVPVQGHLGREFNTALFFSQGSNFLCHWRGKMPNLSGAQTKALNFEN
jgi:hypothetical protein